MIMIHFPPAAVADANHNNLEPNKTMANESINELTKHKFEECSDLPRLTRIGIFSCSACDAWRERVHSRGFGKSFKRRDFMSERHQCSRPKRHMGPIRIRIVYNPGCDTAADPSSSLESSSEVNAVSSFQETKKIEVGFRKKKQEKSGMLRTSD
jgi:hypothetical protein